MSPPRSPPPLRTKEAAPKKQWRFSAAWVGRLGSAAVRDGDPLETNNVRVASGEGVGEEGKEGGQRP